ncbi:RxLR effector protein [Phytophthora megakarya]|uniref:RxLR effector protein n=1 Tax=Phytophthora megakarya TaxID=4795 RepID=A0A225V009_9STRA|nr:RxLR effector protein [Phytophthora megakarya]
MLATLTKPYLYEIGELVQKTKNLQLIQWMNKGNSAHDIFRFLRLNNQNGNLFENPVFSTWVSYVEKLDKANPYITQLLVLRQYFREAELMKMIETAKYGSIDAKLRAVILKKIQRRRFQSKSA